MPTTIDGRLSRPWVEALGLGQAMRAGLDVDASARRDHLIADAATLARSAGYDSFTLKDVCREVLRLGSGSRIPPSGGDVVQRAVSSGAVADIFTTVVNAAILQSYAAYPDSTDGWVRLADVPDFKSNERIRLGAGNTLKKLGRGDKAAHASRASSVEEYKVARYAQQFVIDEQDLIDDRLDAIALQPEEMGQAAAQLRPDLVYAILLANANLADGNALFVADPHGNLGTSSTALSASTLQTAISAMSKQTETAPDGTVRNLNIKPAFLIVPQDLQFTAEIILRSAERIIASTSGGTFNPLRGMMEVRSDNRIGVAGVIDPATGTAYTGTATNYFLAGSPVQHPTIEVGYLSGTGRRPMVRPFTLTQGTWGVGWDIKLDIGAKALDYRALYKATGAS